MASVWVCSLTRPGEHSASSYLVQPYVTAALASKCKCWPAVSNLQKVVTSLANRGKKFWKDHAHTAVEWLQVSAQPVDNNAPAALTDDKDSAENNLAATEPAEAEGTQPANEEDDHDELEPEGTQPAASAT